MTKTRQQTIPAAGESAFDTLIQVAREDSDTRDQLNAILAQPPCHRQSLLYTMIQNLRISAAPAEFIEAATYLLDDTQATKARQLINA